ncbi:MAG: glucuronate isomerase [Bacteroidaceae bacterium]
MVSLSDMLSCLDERIEYFVAHGCKATDHALDTVDVYPSSLEEAEAIFKKAMARLPLSAKEVSQYKFYLLIHLGKQYARHGLVQEYHIGALRNNSIRRYKELGADTGFDAVNDDRVSQNLSLILSTLDETNSLPKTILYTLNSKDYEPLVTLMNCYQSEGIRGKIQFGTSWWFNDHFEGINKQLNILAADGLLSCFVGMLTDSRSFLSYPRHEYFRRLVCNLLGKLVEQGRYPNDIKTLGKIVEDISFNNAKNYFEN